MAVKNTATKSKSMAMHLANSAFMVYDIRIAIRSIK